tara:strand:+ start:231 stop:659 length:429 start_codon:yes stop_codon:yes gene_type:complete
MEIKITKFIRIDRLLQNIVSDSLKDTIRREFAQDVASSSKKFIRDGKVTPKLKKETLKIRRKYFDVHHEKPLLRQEHLVNSIQATPSGVKYLSYGNNHRLGDNRSGTVREFISIRADESEKTKLLNKIKRKYVKKIKENLRK